MTKIAERVFHALNNAADNGIAMEGWHYDEIIADLWAYDQDLWDATEAEMRLAVQAWVMLRRYGAGRPNVPATLAA